MEGKFGVEATAVTFPMQREQLDGSTSGNSWEHWQVDIRLKA
jgi:hypothetical protein